MCKAVYFIPGTMCDERLWQPTWQCLKRELDVGVKLIHLDIPVVQPMAKVIEQLAIQITAPNAILVGFSLGGYIATALALSFPEKLSQLIVVSNQPKNLPEKEIKQRKRTIDWVEKRGYSGIPIKRIYDLLHPDIRHIAGDKHQALISIIAEMDASLGEKVLLQQLNVSMHRRALVNKLARLSFPVSFLIGDADALVDINDLKSTTLQAENISINIVKNTGHMLPLESPYALSTLLIERIKLS